MCRELEERLDLDAVDIYGLSEIIGPGVASERVETKDGLHVWEDHFYPPVDAERAGAALEHRVKDRIGVSVRVEVVAPGGIERSVGKMRRLVDRRSTR